MRSYVMMYCIYNPDGYYHGHKIKHIEADGFDEAEKKGHEWLEGMAGKGKWEYMIAADPMSYRIYDNKEHKRL